MVTPEKALELLLEGNARYISDKSIHPNRDKERRKSLAEKQAPFAIVLSCADSRVSPEILFDQGFGDLFVIRVAGNVIGPQVMESILFAAKYLAAPCILIIGHEKCGAIEAVIKDEIKDIESIAKQIKPSVDKARELQPEDLYETASKLNAKNMSELVSSHPTIKTLIDQSKVIVKPAYLDIVNGVVEILPN